MHASGDGRTIITEPFSFLRGSLSLVLEIYEEKSLLFSILKIRMYLFQEHYPVYKGRRLI